MAKSNTPQSSENIINLDVQNLLMPGAVLGVGVCMMLGFIIGSSIIGNALRAGGIATSNVVTSAATTSTGTVAGNPTNVTQDQIKALFTSGDNMVFGNPDSKLLFVEVADPSCPYCHIAGGKNSELNKSAGGQFLLKQDGGNYVAPVPEIKKLVDEGTAAYVWIYSNGHGNGELSTQAMYCAYEKGKYWPVHDLLFSNAGYDLINNVVKNDKSKATDLAKFLAPAMNEKEMLDCLNSGKYSSRIASDQSLAGSLGVQGTPGYFVNTTNFAGAYSFTDMQTAVNAALGR